MKRSLNVLLLLFITVSMLPAQQKRAYTAADHARLEMPASIAVSPDGQRVAYTIRSADTEASKWITQIHVVNASDHRARKFTSSVASSSAPSWSPDGRWLAFISKREHLDDSLRRHAGSPQLFLLPADGGEASAVTSIANGVDEYVWSPDGHSIAILSEEALSDSAQAEADLRAKKKMDWISSLDPKPGKDLLLLDVQTKQVKTIATLDRGATEPSWSPDGQRLVYQTNYTGEYNDEQKYDLWTVDLGGKKTQLTKTAGPETHPAWSPDGKTIAFITQTVPDIEFAKTELSIMNADGSNVQTVTKAYPYSILKLAWSPDGKTILAIMNEKTSSVLCRISPSKGTVEPVTETGNVVTELSVAKNGTMAVGFETAAALKEIALVRKDGLETLTNYSAQLAPFRFGSQEVITIKSRDGKFDIDAILVKPVNYEKGKRYPLLLAYHGGPYGDYDNKLYQYYPVQLLAQEGVMSVMPNVRGGSGYTDEFSQSNRYDLGGADFRDAMDVVDYLIAQGMVDSTKMGVTGGSYGGYMTNWTISQTARFKAAVSMYGIFSWFTDWSNSFQPSFEQMYFGYNYWERPIDMNNLWFKTSPQTYVKNIVTPTLILQGTEDEYTNISNSREMYAALKQLGRTAEFVVYPRAEHGLRTEPNQYINVLERSVNWFNKYAIGEKK